MAKREECVCGHSKGCHHKYRRIKNGVFVGKLLYRSCMLKSCDCKKFIKKKDGK